MGREKVDSAIEWILMEMFGKKKKLAQSSSARSVMMNTSAVWRLSYQGALSRCIDWQSVEKVSFATLLLELRDIQTPLGVYSMSSEARSVLYLHFAPK